MVDVDVEVPAADWAPLDPPAELAAPGAVLFVDGVRREDAQVGVHDQTGDQAGDQAAPALCASYAAGVVCCCADQGAHLLGAAVRRGLFTTADQGADLVTSAGTYEAVKVETRTPDTAAPAPAQLLSLALQRGLAAVEQCETGAAGRTSRAATRDRRPYMRTSVTRRPRATSKQPQPRSLAHTASERAE